MHLHAVALQHASMELSRVGFSTGFFWREQLDLGVDLPPNQFAGARQTFVMHRFGGQLQLAIALEIAGDLLLLHQ
ncbi:hypothetical protein D9M73_278160 [compost metagenome]